jgi:hypothetical protein
MPSLNGTRAAYERALGHFDQVTVTHGATVGTARGRIFAETSDILTDAIEQGRMKAIILASDLGFVPERGDSLRVVGGPLYSISAVDDATRRLNGTVVAYQVTL